MSDPVSRKSRRNFLLAATAGGAAAGVALVAQKAPTAAPAAQSRRSGAGYVESAHARNYYRSAKV
jgi:nitrous oxide reductase